MLHESTPIKYALLELAPAKHTAAVNGCQIQIESYICAPGCGSVCAVTVHHSLLNINPADHDTNKHGVGCHKVPSPKSQQAAGPTATSRLTALAAVLCVRHQAVQPASPAAAGCPATACNSSAQRPITTYRSGKPTHGVPIWTERCSSPGCHRQHQLLCMLRR